MSNVNEKASENEADFFAGISESGFENLSRDKFKNQFIGIAGGNHPGVTKDTPEYKEFGGKLETGFAFNTATKQVYGKKIRVIPLHIDELLIENTEDERGNLKDFVAAYRYQSPGIDIKGDRFARGADRLRNATTNNPLTPTDVVYCLLQVQNDDFSFVDGQYYKDYVAISFRGTGQPLLRDWLSKMAGLKLSTGAPAPLFGFLWELETMYNRNDDGNWYAWGHATKPYAISATKIRQISNAEGFKHIAPERKILLTAARNYAQIAAGADQSYAAAGNPAEESDEM